MGPEDALPLPDDPALAAMASVLSDAGHWAELVDDRWRFVYATDDLRLSMGGTIERVATPPVGAHYFGPEATRARAGWRSGPNSAEFLRAIFSLVGGVVLADTPGGREELRELVDPCLRDLVDALTPAAERTAYFGLSPGAALRGTEMLVTTAVIRVRDETGRLAGTAIVTKPAPRMSVIAAVAGGGDLQHFERILSVAKAARRPAAVLFADLEGSSPLARRLSTASYFALGRRLVRAADDCVVDAGGLVGRHVGDGVAAFFLAENAGSESAAARACITAARELRAALAAVAERSGLAPEDVVLRFGLHWGATLFVGQIMTRGRAEVTALGDEVNEAARIEACATGGRALASKALVERLDADDAAALGLDPDRISYTALAQLPSATEKARRDAPAIAVCDV
ncbi:MAG TPA: adenylate/guanylate cyclase domain-containing protein [Solirubrobacteraceae bacterium]|nr:adenylate/guanylate cyclase domain-containing protein [Solirubrobacteraceae bacterium]